MYWTTKRLWTFRVTAMAHQKFNKSQVTSHKSQVTKREKNRSKASVVWVLRGFVAVDQAHSEEIESGSGICDAKARRLLLDVSGEMQLVTNCRFSFCFGKRFELKRR